MRLMLAAMLNEDGGDMDREHQVACFVLIFGDAVSSTGASKQTWSGQLESCGRGAVVAGGARRRSLVISTATLQGSVTGPRRCTYAAIA